MKNLTNTLLEYLSGPTDYAIQIVGGYGRGKTHFYKTVMQDIILAKRTYGNERKWRLHFRNYGTDLAKVNLILGNSTNITFKYHNAQYRTGKELIFAGETQSTLFIFNRKDSSAWILPRTVIDSLVVKNRWEFLAKASSPTLKGFTGFTKATRTLWSLKVSNSINYSHLDVNRLRTGLERTKS